MKKILITLVILLTTLTLVNSALASPPRQEGQNLLQNPSFEGSYSTWNGISQLQMPVGWNPWWQAKGNDDPDWKNNRPEWKPAEGEIFPNRVHSGSKAIQWFWAYSTYNAGAYQQVNVPANAQLRFSGYAMGWSCEKFKDCPDATSYNPANMAMSIGIDPTGGTDAFSSNIVWSGTYNYLDNWGYLEVEATAQGSVVTVFMRSNPDWPKQNQDTYFDDVSLVAIGESVAP
ncbi:MAG: hypothetical protein JXA42_26985, partial [Anaerolineales bacterium]|nr:hypothetical protein [Anaerolineales bacterium]